MRSVTFVDATDLAFWANRREAQAKLPQLVRRLVHANAERVLHAGFRAGEGVQLGGWDGVVVVERGNAFVPEGASVWEMGTTADVKGKADADYEKRCADPEGIDPSQTAFVFVTPRRWGGKDDWLRTRQAEQVWREVRAYDADDLEQWLELAPAVHVWLSILLGKHPEEVMDLGSFWDDWAAVTQPPVSPEFVLAGRDGVVSHIHEWLRGSQATLALKAESRDESLAVFAAAVQQLPPEELVAYLSRAVLVYGPAAWRSLTASEDSLILIPMFGSREAVARATRTGHRVVFPLGPADSESDNTMKIPRLSRAAAARALTASGIAEDEARDLASLARKSLMSYRRRQAVLPEEQQPEWARPAEARPLLPALLAGAWGDTAVGDRQAIATLAQSPYEEVSRTIIRWANENEPPVRNVSGGWFLTSKEDSWSLLARYLRGDDLERFEQVALEALGTPDPRFDMPKGERYMARFQGRTLRHSGVLRKEIADTLAFMGARGDALSLVGDVSARGWATRIVRRLLEQADGDWRVWASLSDFFPPLAEAAPDIFLLAVEEGLKGEQPVLLRLFTEQEKGLFGDSPHVGLLWALETLAWSPEYLARAALLLAKLTRLEPADNNANRTGESLRGIFLLWLPQTTATLEQRLRVLDVIREREPEVAWNLMKQLLPKDYGVGHTAATPRWRDWAPDASRDSPPPNYATGVREIVTRVLADAGESGDRWAALIWALPVLEDEHYEAIVERLTDMEVGRLQASDRAAIWNALRSFISRHRSFPDEDWAIATERVDRLSEIFERFEPQEVTNRYGWLFGHSPSLPEGLEREWAEHEEAVKNVRFEAIRAIYRREGIAGVLELVGCVERPFDLGTVLGESGLAEENEDELLRENLAGEDMARAHFARGFAFGRFRVKGAVWLGTKLADGGLVWSPPQRAEFLTCLPLDPQTWELTEVIGPETDRAYWQRVNPYVVGEKNAEHAARKLLAHNRPHAAIELLGLHVRRDKEAPAALIAEALERLLDPSPKDDGPSSSVAHSLPRLLKALAASGGVEEGRVARLEWAFMSGIDRMPEVLHRELKRNPGFFSELVSLIFRAEGEEPREASEEEQARGTRAYRLLQSWRSLPGETDGRVVDAEALKSWVRRARELLAASGRGAVGDKMLGELLSGSPYGEDGAWPHPAVRDLIEEVASTSFERGVEIGAFNSRGVMIKNPAEGGDREREIAQRYAGFAATVRDHWPRTAAMLKRIADGYDEQAGHEDRDLRLRDELYP